MLYSPMLPVRVARSAEVPMLFTETLAPTTTAPRLSRTVPEMDPLSAWDQANW
jgi:hypothetical protein